MGGSFLLLGPLILTGILLFSDEIQVFIKK
jgi:hypothetical protein